MQDIILSPLSLGDFRQLLREEIQASLALSPLAHQAPPQPEPIGGIDMAEQITGLRKQTIYGLVSSRAIPCMKVGKRLYFDRAELLEWIKAGKKKTIGELNAEAEAVTQRKRKGPRA